MRVCVTTLLLPVLLAANATPSGAQAQSPAVRTPARYAAPTVEIGFFTYDSQRYPNDVELRFSAGLGYRYETRGLFVEPQVRGLFAVDPDRGGSEQPCSEYVCPGSGAIDEIPLVWPGVNLGLVDGDEYGSRSYAMRVALGIGSGVQPLLGFRYEGSARWMGWFAEATVERLRWASPAGRDAMGFPAYTAGKRWEPGLHVGARIWMRSVDVPAPKTPLDAGIIPPEPARPKQ